MSRLADTNFYACFSRGRIRLHADVIVNRIAKTLLGYALEIADVMPGLFNDLGAVVVPTSLVCPAITTSSNKS